MNQKRLLLALGCLAAVLLAGYVALRLTATRQQFTSENIKAIKTGMTEQEVDAVLGAKAEVFPSDRTCYGFRGRCGLELLQDSTGKEWLGDKISVAVWF